jgi:hypothetical protein
MRTIVFESSVISKSAHRFLLAKSQLPVVGWPPAAAVLPGGAEPEPDAFRWPDDEGLCIEGDSRARLRPTARLVINPSGDAGHHP